MLIEFFRSFHPSSPGYLFMWVLLGMFVWMAAVALERIVAIWGRANVNAERFMGEIRKLVRAGDFKKAISLCRLAGRRALPRVVLAALEEAQRHEFIDYRAIQNAIDEATLEVIPELQRRTSFLALIGNVATLTGLTGTIFGLMISFRAAGGAGAGTGELAQGIAVAMTTTLTGLLVAIPAIVAHGVVSAKTNRIIEEIDEHAVKLIHLLTGGA